MPERHVLLVDNDPATRRFLRTLLEGEGYQVSLGQPEEDVLQQLELERPDLVVLQVPLPGLEGLNQLRQLRKRSQVLVLVVSSIENRWERIAALDLGADDYMVKPFDVDEFLARVRSLLRRAGGDWETAGPAFIDLGGLQIDLHRHCLLLTDTEVQLSRTEWRLLSLLAANLDHVMSHRTMLSKVWGPEFVDDVQYLRTCISSLRHKMGDHPTNPRYLVTIPGVGYLLRRAQTVAV